MSITDELREYAKGSDGVMYGAYQALLAIADRIDAEHERLCSRSRSNGYSDGFNDGFNDIESWVIDHEDAMAEHGWVRKNKEHVISHATVEVTPHIDWVRMADELDEFVEIVRGMAGGAE